MGPRCQRDRVALNKREVRRELDLQMQRRRRQENHAADQCLAHRAGGAGRNRSSNRGSRHGASLLGWPLGWPLGWLFDWLFDWLLLHGVRSRR